MGNRAVVIFTDREEKRISPMVYLQWNGGPESVYAFLDELNTRNIRADQDYECARFIQLVADFFDGGEYLSGLSIGVSNGPKTIEPEAIPDIGDNGAYIICRQRKPNPDEPFDNIDIDKNMRVKRFHSFYSSEGEAKKARKHDAYKKIIEFFEKQREGKIISQSL